MRRLQSLSIGLLTSLFLFLTPAAKAGILLEPYLGYEMGTLHFDATALNGGTSDPSFTSPALGARLGITFPVFFAALDYQTYLGAKVKDSNSSGDATGSNLYVDVGVSLPLIRAYAGYGVMNKFNTKDTNNNDVPYDDSTAFKLGVGTTLLPIVALNLEYHHEDFNKVNNSQIKAKLDTFMLSVSVPFNL